MELRWSRADRDNLRPELSSLGVNGLQTLRAGHGRHVLIRCADGHRTRLNPFGPPQSVEPVTLASTPQRGRLRRFPRGRPKEAVSASAVPGASSSIRGIGRRSETLSGFPLRLANSGPLTLDRAMRCVPIRMKWHGLRDSPASALRVEVSIPLSFVPKRGVPCGTSDSMESRISTQ